MEGAKTAMYAQAGKNRGWTSVVPAKEEAVIQQSATVIPIPEPPVVKLPVMEEYDWMAPQEDCQNIAMGFVETQEWQKLYEPDHGFSCGTIFAELDLPFMGKGACRDD